MSKTAVSKLTGKMPVSAVEWVDRSSLNPNNYNPNKVAQPELDLLALSIIEDGWTQPIVAHPDGTIVDGFHRWMVSAREAVSNLTGGLVPVVRVKLDPNHAMMSTIRHNRARGTHGVMKMADIVRLIVEDGLTEEEVCTRLGMEDEELERLLDRSGMTIQGTDGQFGRSWIPADG